MALLLRKSVERSVRDFEDELVNYFAAARHARSKMRRGTIILVDKDAKLFDFLNFLVDKCGIPVAIVHVDEACCAKRAIKDIGVSNVKAVVVAAEMLDRGANGASLLQWLSLEYREIPVWVSKCPPEREMQIRKSMSRVGVIGVDRVECVHALGLPEECEKAARQYVL